MAAVNSTSTSTFADRLNKALDYRGTTTTPDKIARLTAATGCSARVVSRWLSSACVPRSRGPWLTRVTRDLDASPWWLYSGEPWCPHTGDGGSPWQTDTFKKLSALPPEYLPKFIRYCIRLNNGDPKALRWSAMCERGELTGWQVLDMA